MIEEVQALKMLADVGAVLTNGHFVYTSGKHGSVYVNKDLLYAYAEATSDLCCVIAKQFVDDNVDAVIAPAIGGVILSQWVAYHLSKLTDCEVLAVYAEKSDDGDTFVIKRGYDKLIAGKRVLAVDDVLTTGGSAKKVIEATRAIGGEVIGLGALCNRGGITPQDVANVPKLFALTNISLDAWTEEECLLCKQGVPINTEVGKGQEFLARKSGDRLPKSLEALGLSARDSGSGRVGRR